MVVNHIFTLSVLAYLICKHLPSTVNVCLSYWRESVRDRRRDRGSRPVNSAKTVRATRPIAVVWFRVARDWYDAKIFHQNNTGHVVMRLPGENVPIECDAVQTSIKCHRRVFKVGLICHHNPPMNSENGRQRAPSTWWRIVAPSCDVLCSLSVCVFVCVCARVPVCDRLLRRV